MGLYRETVYGVTYYFEYWEEIGLLKVYEPVEWDNSPGGEDMKTAFNRFLREIGEE